MSRIASLFKGLEQEGKRAVIPFLTAGDPSPEATLDLLTMLAEEGLSLIHI